MSITSYGYDNAIAATGAQWAQHQEILAVPYACADLTAGLIGNTSGGVTVGAGVIGGQGVLDTIGSAETYTWAGEPASGTEWFMIVAHRSWSGTAATTIKAISAGTTSPVATLPARDQTPGTLDDQPLGLIPWTAGQSSPGDPIDLRGVSGGRNGSLLIADERALQYLDWPGATVRLGTTTYHRDPSGSGGLKWTKSPGAYGLTNTGPWTSIPVASAAGFTPATCEGLIVGNQVSVSLSFKHVSGAFVFTTPDGGCADTLIGQITPGAYRPDRTVWPNGQIEVSAPNKGAFGADFKIDPSGYVYLISGPAGSTLRLDTTDAGISVALNFTKAGS